MPSNIVLTLGLFSGDVGLGGPFGVTGPAGFACNQLDGSTAILLYGQVTIDINESTQASNPSDPLAQHFQDVCYWTTNNTITDVWNYHVGSAPGGANTLWSGEVFVYKRSSDNHYMLRCNAYTAFERWTFENDLGTTKPSCSLFSGTPLTITYRPALSFFDAADGVCDLTTTPTCTVET